MFSGLFTERLHLRKMAVSDAGDLFRIWCDPEVTKFMNIEQLTEVRQAAEIARYLEQLAQEKKAIRYSIIEVNSNKIIGSCGYNTLDFENAKTEIGYELAKNYWGKGYAPETIAALVHYAFTTLQFNRVEAKVEPDNLSSIRVLQKLNFTYEGTLRQTEKSKGKFIDLSIYSRLATD